MRYLILLLFSVSCTTTTPQSGHSLQTQVDSLQSQVIGNTYLINTDGCFIQYHQCVLAGKNKSKRCWVKHEKCVINAYRQYQKILKKRKHK